MTDNQTNDSTDTNAEPTSEDAEKDSISEWFTSAIGFLSRHDAYTLIKGCLKRSWERKGLSDTEKSDRGYRFTDRWVFSNLILSVVGSAVAYALAGSGVAGRVLSGVFAAWGVYRILEIVLTQANNLLVVAFDRRQRGLVVKSLKRSLILLLANCAEIMFWFSCITMLLLGIFDGGIEGDWFFAVSTSAFGCLTFDSDRVFDIVGGNSSHWIRYVALVEATVGSFMNVVVITTFVSSIPGIRSITEEG